LKMLRKNLIHLPLTILQKDFEKYLQKEFAKTKLMVQAWSKMLKNKGTIHAYQVSNIYWLKF
jgi:chloramphenicol O-acetyltransferase